LTCLPQSSMTPLHISPSCTQFHTHPNSIPTDAPFLQSLSPPSSRTTHAPHPQEAGHRIFMGRYPTFVHTQVSCTTLALTRHTESQYPGSIQHPHTSVTYRTTRSLCELHPTTFRQCSSCSSCRHILTGIGIPSLCPQFSGNTFDCLPTLTHKTTSSLSLHS
jgi:hypothetical protein